MDSMTRKEADKLKPVIGSVCLLVCQHEDGKMSRSVHRMATGNIGQWNEIGFQNGEKQGVRYDALKLLWYGCASCAESNSHFSTVC